MTSVASSITQVICPRKGVVMMMVPPTTSPPCKPFLVFIPTLSEIEPDGDIEKKSKKFNAIEDFGDETLTCIQLLDAITENT